MARVLIVGCGCRGRELATELAERGHAVRGTTRDPGSVAGIEDAGAEAVVANPDRLGTLLSHLDGVSALVWLMGSARGDEEAVAALHGSRLESIAGKLVDTHVRGLVYEASGSVDPELLRGGARTVRAVGQANRMPVEVVEVDPGDPRAWTAAMAEGVSRVLSG